MATHNITGNHLNDTTLNITTNVGPPETINVRGLTEMNPSIQWGDNLTVNLKANSEWVGGFGANPGSKVTVNGSGVFHNTASFMVGSGAKIGVNVVGHGTFMVNQAHGNGTLEFLHGVSAGQTVTDTGYEGYHDFGKVQVDDPAAYHAANVLGFGEIIFEGIKASSYSLKDDLLSMYRGGHVIYQTRLAFTSPPVPTGTFNGNTAPTNFGVSQVGGSVVVHADGSSYQDGGHLLAIHA